MTVLYQPAPSESHHGRLSQMPSVTCVSRSPAAMWRFASAQMEEIISGSEGKAVHVPHYIRCIERHGADSQMVETAGIHLLVFNLLAHFCDNMKLLPIFYGYFNFFFALKKIFFSQILFSASKKLHWLPLVVCLVYNIAIHKLCVLYTVLPSINSICFLANDGIG